MLSEILALDKNRDEREFCVRSHAGNCGPNLQDDRSRSINWKFGIQAELTLRASEFVDKSKDCNLVRLAKCASPMTPSKELLPMFNSCRFERFPRLSGSEPLKLLLLRYKILNDLNPPMDTGIGPENEFISRSRCSRCLKLLNQSGIGP
ncbi:hypothetical protein GIB67_002355 [Kingdonia uniflora]|uniref:Uncharacterized protein n=1 Tax=Kingdonia uniflora TaxID=39325 RepID=A0A7J7LXF4_9MAGN|nr:hypothetical protein GIB67_002355 [Kingdonia uniflora]